MGSRILLTIGVDMSRDHSKEHATEPQSTDKQATKDVPSQLRMHQKSGHTDNPKEPRRLQVFCHNVGGLGAGMYEDLMGFLDQSHYDIALVQETKLRVNSEYVTPNWICVGSGTDTQKHAGVMILVRKTITNVQEVRHDSIIPGRLLRVRFPLGKDSCKLSVICAYQHAWNPKDPNTLAKREAFWHKLFALHRRHTTQRTRGNWR